VVDLVYMAPVDTNITHSVNSYTYSNRHMMLFFQGDSECYRYCKWFHIFII